MKLNKGFTLIELIVVMVIFLFVIGAAIGIFISIIKQQWAVLAEQEFLNQISYAEEHMSKALRMASASTPEIDPSGSCLSGTGNIYLLSNRDQKSGLYKDIHFINQSDNNICQEFSLDGGGNLLSADLQINYAGFVVNGGDNSCNGPGPCVVSGGGGKQPRVTILLNVSIPGENQGNGDDCNPDKTCQMANQACYLRTNKCMPTKTIQTTVSQRNLNVNNEQ